MIKRTLLTAVTAATTGALLLSGPLAAHGQATARTSASPAASATPATTPLNALRHAATRYRNLQRAENAGYGFFTDTKGIACIAMSGMGGMGVHFVKSALVGDPSERVRQPEAMVYRVNPQGKLVLSAAEYVVIKSAWDAKHSSPPKLFGHTFQLTPAGNRYGLPAYYSLHAWAWYHNPAGTFAPYNPRVHC
jgi:hypothetical protein